MYGGEPHGKGERMLWCVNVQLLLNRRCILSSAIVMEQADREVTFALDLRLTRDGRQLNRETQPPTSQTFIG